MADNDRIPNMRNIIKMFEGRTTVEDVCTEESATDTEISERANGSEGEQIVGGSNPAADFEALIERLERVTTRLERLPVLRARPLTPPQSPALQPSAPESPIPQSTAPQSPEPQSSAPTPPQEVELPETPAVDSMSVIGYQDLMQGPLRTYLELSQQIGGDVATHANLVNEAFQAQLRYIQLAQSRSKPSQAEEVQLLAPTSEKISAIQQFREKNRVSSFFNHLSAISESIPALGWVAVSPTPAPYVKEMNDAGQFYTNRVLKEWKEKDKRHVEWCRAWVQLLSDLQAYVKQQHTTGLVWSGTGAGAPPPPPPGGLPPPPPMLPEADFANLSVDDRSALFAEINQGEGITSNLRKVTADMQTHKNPTLRQGPAPFKAAHSAPAPAPAPAKPLPQPGAGKLDKPPVFMRDGKKWIIEYQKGNSNLVVENADMNNVVYMYRCRDSALTVRGKINGVVLDSCTKCAVVFDNLVSSVEFVNCQSVQMQGESPTHTTVVKSLGSNSHVPIYDELNYHLKLINYT
ncbi:Adenylyl cyclase-associated protein 1 [Papilio xuthus]|uniref:Adenylyl cyclase-associated protein n=1 Tax=Papilio xuthus TaxID=66420 RepID=A0A194PPP8_PAPXU|nr:Adenylyl cyclase-associated protein 1 [Papilio xuthus]